ncbi:YunG family protein [Actinoplanes sp. CA-252034]|uniref:YunG family protein n=1 Tax=Actinoplanes sp. CA-252034 TaxID=3239906 RepID=UPI003D97C7E0
MIDLELLRPALRAGWGPDTCDPHDLRDWHPGNPARGQCGVTALIVHDLLGGELILGEVLVGEAKVGHHYWNRLPDGREVDLTAGQFHPGETVVGSRVQQRPPGAPRRCRSQYETLRRRVLTTLADTGAVRGRQPTP